MSQKKEITILKELYDSSKSEVEKIHLKFQYLAVSSIELDNLYSEISKCEILNELELNFFQESPVQVNALRQLLPFISKLKNLKCFSFSMMKKKISYQDAYQLSYALSSLDKLESLILNFGQNQIWDSGVTGLRNGIFYLHKTLRCINLNLSQNEITDFGCIELGQGISQCFNLQELYLDFKDCEINKMKGLFPIIEKCLNIRILTIDLTNNRYIRDLEQFTKKLSEIKCLEVLCLHIKAISSTENDEEVGNNISLLSNLKYFAFTTKAWYGQIVFRNLKKQIMKVKRLTQCIIKIL